MLANSILQACVLWDRCEDSNKEIRDGSPQNVNDAATDTIPDNGATIAADNQGARRFGYHEPHEWYTACKTRSRNRGLFIADRRLNKRDARSTRQNNNGNRRGLECPEERDYYPYWTPTPWRDIAVLVDDVERCDYYKNNSNNVKKYGECLGGTLGRNQVRPITETECVAMGFKWHEAYAARTAWQLCRSQIASKASGRAITIPVMPAHLAGDSGPLPSPFSHGAPMHTKRPSHGHALQGFFVLALPPNCFFVC